MVVGMESTWRQEHLPEIVTTLGRRPGHGSVRTLVADILRYGFGVAYHAIDHEVRLGAHFMRQRRAIRAALAADGIAARITRLSPDCSAGDRYRYGGSMDHARRG